ncbi:MAG: type II toxin-antitoxin system RelE/ParE family toxin [Pseudomonadota bacterium]
MTDLKRLSARFYRSDNEKEPVRDWLLGLDGADRKSVGEDIRTAEFGWPVGMPICRAISGRRGVWEIRSSLAQGRIARVLFCVRGDSMILLHGFIKKSQKTPDRDLDIAVRRMRGLR